MILVLLHSHNVSQGQQCDFSFTFDFSSTFLKWRYLLVSCKVRLIWDGMVETFDRKKNIKGFYSFIYLFKDKRYSFIHSFKKGFIFTNSFKEKIHSFSYLSK